MDKQLIFMGPLYPRSREEELRRWQKRPASAAPNVFQWSLLDGLAAQVDGLSVVNVLPVGTWPKICSKAVLPDGQWAEGNISGREIGCWNLPFFKQYIRYRKTRRLLKRLATPGAEIVIYSAYMPFLKAVYRLPSSVKVTAIITDLPEFYDLEQVSALRAWLRRRQNKIIYRNMERVDRFVVLTEQMVAPLQVGSRPWMRMEGIYGGAFDPDVAPSGKGILYSGSLHRQYGILDLLEAFASVEDPQAELWICGSGDARQEVEAAAAADPRIRFFGFCTQREVADLRSRAAMLVNPRSNCGEFTKYSFPSKTMEYLASGKPVVMYRLDGVPEEYDPYLFYADDLGGLSGAMDWVLRHYQKACPKAAAGRQFIQEKKNAASQAKRLLEFLNQ